MTSTLSQGKEACGSIWTYCRTDPRLVAQINVAQQRLLPMGKWPDTYQHYRFCVRSACITLPWQLETLESCAINLVPFQMRNEWFQYIRDGYGLLGSNPLSFQDEGSGWVAFEDVIGLNKKLRVYSDTPEDPGLTILLNFWNENNLPVRTLDGTRWINGEKVPIENASNDTTNFCMAKGLVGVQKPVTNGNVFLYEYDTVLTTQRLLARYEPDETLPNYRRYSIPFCGTTGTGECATQTVDVIAKRRFIPAREDEDVLIVGNTAALKLACQALRLEEDNQMAQAVVYWGMARKVLDDELNQFLGDGVADLMQLQDEFANAGVLSMI